MSREAWFGVAFLLFQCTPSFAFNTAQHHSATSLAASDLINTPHPIDQLGSVYPDIEKFRSVIVPWTGGVGRDLSLIGYPGNELPAEQLAHTLTQVGSICSVSGNGGDYLLLRDGVFIQYGIRKFARPDVSDEGAYVLMGAMLHLIEDQSSMPHGANIHHGECLDTFLYGGDKFENPGDKTDVSLAKAIGNSTIPNAYRDSLSITQGLVPHYTSESKGGARLWLTNIDLFNAGRTGKTSTVYTGLASQDPEGPFGGAYGGANDTDIYSPFEQQGLYGQQGTQASDFAYFFLKRMSESLPPIGAELAIGNGASGTPPAINSQVGTPVTFRISENRTQRVKVNLIVDDGPAAVTESGNISLSGARSTSGSDVTAPLQGPITWSNYEVGLLSTKTNDLTLLPFDGNVRITWKGQIANGQIPNGQHKLCLIVRDEESSPNTSAGPAEGRIDTCMNFMVGATPPQLSLLDSFGFTLHDVSGDASAIPSTLAAPITKTFHSITAKSPATFSIADQAGIKSLAVTGPNGSVPLAINNVNGSTPAADPNPAILDPGTNQLGGFFAALDPGIYTVTSINQAGLQTSAKFKVATLEVGLDPTSAATFDPMTGLMNGTFNLNLDASEGLDHLDEYDRSTYKVTGTKDLSAAGSHSMLTYSAAAPSIFGGQPKVLATSTIDKDGNSFLNELTIRTVFPLIGQNGDILGILPTITPPFILSPGTPGTFNNTSIIFGQPAAGPMAFGLTTSDAGTYASNVFDVFASSVMPGSFFVSGQSPPGVPPFFAVPVRGAALMGDVITGPLTDELPLMSISLSIVTSDNKDLSGASPVSVYTGNMVYRNGNFVLDNVPSVQVTLKHYYQYRVALSLLPQNSVARRLCTDPFATTTCQGHKIIPAVIQIGSGFMGLQTSTFRGPSSNTDFEAGIDLASDLGLGFEISHFNTSSQGTLNVAVGSRSPDPGYQGVPPNTVFNVIASDPAFYTGPFTLGFKLDSSQLSTAQLDPNLARLVPIDASGKIGQAISFSTSAVDANTTMVSFVSNSFGRFMLLAPQFSNVAVNTLGDLSLLTPGVPVTITAANPTSPALTPLIAGLRSSGLGLVSQVYQVGPSGTQFSPAAAMKIAYSPALAASFGASPSALSIVQFDVNEPAQILPNQFRDYQQPLISASVPSVASYFAVFAATNAIIAADGTPPVTQIVFSSSVYLDGANRSFISSGVSIGFSAADSSSTAAASGVDFTEYRIDAGTAAAFVRFVSTFALAEGSHTIEYRSKDKAGNLEATKTYSLSVDATPPLSSVVAGGPSASLGDGTVLVGVTTPFALSAADPVSNGVASGVGTVRFQIGGGTLAVYASSFTLPAPDGPVDLSFWSTDNVGNVEAKRSTTVVMDATPPTVAILNPAPGFGAVVQGVVPIAGSIGDAHLSSWRLEAATGAYASSGFALIASGTAALSAATLGAWDASQLSGWQTLRLTADDLVANEASASVNVFVGDPNVALNISGLNKPEGVAVGADGTIAVADRNNDRVKFFSSTGTLLSSLTKAGGTAFNKPAAVAVEPGGDVLVADTNNNRMVRLTVQGQVRWTVSDLGHPSGVAFDAVGNAYASDTDHGRVRKFASDGSLLLDFALSGFQPAGIAVDSGGRLYAADPARNRVVVFSSTGAETGILGPGLGLNAPSAVAVGCSGECPVISDTGNRRVLKISPDGARTLSFGSEGRDAVFNQPIGLALDAAGALYVADRNNDRIVKLGPPTLTPPATVSAASSRSARPAGFGAGGLRPLATDASLGIHAAYVFPNPARGINAITIRVQPGAADGVDVNVYDLAGRRVYHSSNFTNRGAFDDGNGAGPQFTFDNVWDISGIGSGIYRYVVTAHKAGQSDVHKADRLGIVK